MHARPTDRPRPSEPNRWTTTEPARGQLGQRSPTARTLSLVPTPQPALEEGRRPNLAGTGADQTEADDHPPPAA